MPKPLKIIDNISIEQLKLWLRFRMPENNSKKINFFDDFIRVTGGRENAWNFLERFTAFHSWKMS